jgi:acetyl esterase/lipase
MIGPGADVATVRDRPVPVRDTEIGARLDEPRGDTPTTVSGFYVTHGGAGTLAKKKLEWFFHHCIPAGFEHPATGISSPHAPYPPGPPTAIVATDEHDPLCDERWAYVPAPRDAGVAVTDRHYERMLPGFLSYANLCSTGDEAVDLVDSNIASVLIHKGVAR